MRWSSMVRVGLSGTSLALAMMGCREGDDAAKEAPPETAEVAEAAGKDAELDAERAEEQSKERELEAARRRRSEEARRLAERDASGEPAPWFLRGPGDTKQASVQGGSQGEQPQQIRDPNPEQPKPVQQQVKPTPTKPVQRPRGWQHRAACGRG